MSLKLTMLYLMDSHRYRQCEVGESQPNDLHTKRRRRFVKCVGEQKCACVCVHVCVCVWGGGACSQMLAKVC